ncbi:MAG: cupin domain-containing protein [Saprospiraceae bacterium]|jgi:quercetin dioxygenase-like cupin family protein|nr:cupin domain-containing protein [Saprospiraceae bacterium]MBL0025234.1 cupin domain-containing protein [Saprospiraceae bacterium]
MKASKEYLLGNDIPWEEVGPGLKRQIMGYDDKIMLVKVDFKEGAIGTMHNHHHSQVTYVESGEFEMTIGDQVKKLKGGDSFYIPPFVMHGCVCVKDGKLIDVFSPVREDFLGHPMKEIK